MTKPRAFLRWITFGGPLLAACSQSPGGGEIPAPIPRDGVPSTLATGVGGTSGTGVAGAADDDGIATDNSPAVRATVPPPAISGGNLLVTQDGKFVVIADSDRDRLVVVDTAATKIVADLALKAGDEPGRLVEDAAGRVHVALRRGGALVTLDLASLSIVDRRTACQGPRGLAYDAAHQSVIVACADGQLVTLPSAGGRATESVFIGPDLRDVIVKDGGLWVSTFKSAKLLRVDAGGVVGATYGVPQLTGNVLAKDANPISQFQPEVAWRTAALGGKIMMLHQAAQLDEIELAGPSGTGGTASVGPEPGGVSPYGSGDGCSGVVRAAVSSIEADGTVHTSAALGAGTLPVDFDVASNDTLAVAFAGTGGSSGEMGKFFSPPQTFALFLPNTLSSGPVVGAELGGVGGAGGAGDIAPAEPTGSTSAFPDCVSSDSKASVPQPVVALRFNPANPDELFLFSRNPATLYRVSVRDQSTFALTLGGADVSDTGHELFHTDAGRGIACASCHPEGGEDGHVWTFSGQGARRTQALTAGLAQTAPFHWDGTLANVGAVMDEVFVKRMGGLHESPERVGDLEHWLFSLPVPPALLAPTDESALRGAVLFNSAEVGCATCHSGAAFTNNLSVLVGTSGTVPLQVPSLLGISHRAPFMHTGCAVTLLDRFNPSCGGGDLHGHTSQLTAAQLDDLTAYLETL